MNNQDRSQWIQNDEGLYGGEHDEAAGCPTCELEVASGRAGNWGILASEQRSDSDRYLVK
jgi:hypothetical protein